MLYCVAVLICCSCNSSA